MNRKYMNYKYVLTVVVVLLIGIAIGYILVPIVSTPATYTPTTITIPIEKTVTIAVERTITVPIETVVTITTPIEFRKTSIIDALGRVIEFEKTPSRGISLTPSTTEKLFVLGLEEVIVGVDSYSNYPKRVLELVNESKITVVGGPWTPDLEKIIALKPDLVIMCRGIRPQEALYPKLEEVGIKTVFLLCDSARNPYDIYSDLHTIGVIFGVEERAKTISNEIESKISEILAKLEKANVSKKRVLYLIGPPSWGLYSAGGDTFIGWLINTAKGVNIARAYSGWPRLDYEFILQSDPEVIIVSAHGVDPKELYNELLNTPIVKTSAWSNKRVYLFTDEANDVLNRPGPRIVVALEILVHVVHPEVFGEIQRADVHRVVEE